MLVFSLIPFAVEDEISNPATKPSKVVGVRKLHVIYCFREQLYHVTGERRGDFQEKMLIKYKHKSDSKQMSVFVGLFQYRNLNG